MLAFGLSSGAIDNAIGGLIVVIICGLCAFGMKHAPKLWAHLRGGNVVVTDEAPEHGLAKHVFVRAPNGDYVPLPLGLRLCVSIPRELLKLITFLTTLVGAAALGAPPHSWAGLLLMAVHPAALTLEVAAMHNSGLLPVSKALVIQTAIFTSALSFVMAGAFYVFSFFQ